MSMESTQESSTLWIQNINDGEGYAEAVMLDVEGNAISNSSQREPLCHLWRTPSHRFKVALYDYTRALKAESIPLSEAVGSIEAIALTSPIEVKNDLVEKRSLRTFRAKSIPVKQTKDRMPLNSRISSMFDSYADEKHCKKILTEAD